VRASLSGGWLRRAWDSTPLEKLHTADPAHSVAEPADPTVGAWGAPPIQSTSPAPYLYDDQGFSDTWVADTTGMVMDTTPLGPEHGYGGRNYPDGPATPFNPGDLAYQQASAAAHWEDHGASRAYAYDVPPFQASDEVYWTARIEGLGSEVGDAIPALAGGGQRGLNGLSVNNPPLEMYGGKGMRNGWVEQAGVMRRMYDGERVHDERFNEPNVAAIGQNVPVPKGAGAYNSPFADLARAITNVNQTPLMRRTPPPIDQASMDDGQDSAYAGYSDNWVMS
jgi:hypothetical protein